MQVLVRLVATVVLAAAIAAPAVAAASGLRPDDRAIGPRAEIAAAVRHSVRPDDRAGYRGAVVSVHQAPAPAAADDSFHFGDAALGAVAATGTILLVFGAALVVLRRRSRLAL